MENKEIKLQQLGQAAGGTVNKNPSPKNTTNIVDDTVNGENYDAIAEAIARKINPAPPRKRKVDNSHDIYDVSI